MVFWFFNLIPFTGATLWGPDLINCLPFTLDNDFYRQLRCRRCASNLLFWPWHFFNLSKRSRKHLFFNLIPWMDATLWGPDLRNCLPFTLDNDFYTQLRCRTCASNLLFWPRHFFDLSKRSRKTFFLAFYNFSIHSCLSLYLSICPFINLTQFNIPFTPPTRPFTWYNVYFVFMLLFNKLVRGGGG